MSSRMLIWVSLILLGVLFIAGGYYVLQKKNKPDVYVSNEEPSQNPQVLGMENANTESDTVTLLFVGDIMLSRSIGKIMEAKHDWTYHFQKVADVLRAADLTFANLEGPIGSRGTKVGSIYSFRADPRSVEGLTYAGIDVVSIANNHMWDYGKLAFLDTLSILKERGVAYTGGGLSYDEAHTPLVKEVKGTKIAFLAYTDLLPKSLGQPNAEPAVAFPNEEQMAIDIQTARSLADIVVVSFHFGEEYKTIHNVHQQKLAHMAIDDGADLVVGHHPHVGEDLEHYKDGFIAYSLGNFVFDQNFSEDTKSGLVLSVTLKNKKIDSTQVEKVYFTNDFQPYFKQHP